MKKITLAQLMVLGLCAVPASGQGPILTEQWEPAGSLPGMCFSSAPPLQTIEPAKRKHLYVQVAVVSDLDAWRDPADATTFHPFASPFTEVDVEIHSGVLAGINRAYDAALGQRTNTYILQPHAFVEPDVLYRDTFVSRDTMTASSPHARLRDRDGHETTNVVHVP